MDELTLKLLPERASAIFLERLDGSSKLLRLFLVHANTAATRALWDRAVPTAGEIERVAAIVVRRCFETVLCAGSLPSKGALRDAAEAAGAEAVHLVLGEEPAP